VSGRSGPTLTFPELFELPGAVNLRTAARAMGFSLGTAYKLVRRGTFPCTVLRPGHRYVVPTAGLLRALEIDSQPIYATDVEEGETFAAQCD
jgi:hypothetical protein